MRSAVLLGMAELLFIGSPAASQTVPVPWTWQISSDFGPRDRDDGPALSWDFHEGVDYNAAPGDTDLGTPIPVVESGNITSISDPDAERFLTVRVEGIISGDEWLYGHIFRNTTQIIGDWELRRNALHINALDPTVLRRAAVIIKFSGGDVVKILSTIPDAFISDGVGGFLSNTQGAVLTRRFVNALEDVAPMGDSNATNVTVHLHLGLNYPLNNPMFHLQHPPDPLPTATVLNPPANKAFAPNDLTNPVRFEVNLNSVGALDVDKATFWLYRENLPVLKLGAPGQPTFNYGGRPGEALSADTNRAPTTTQSGVMPQGNVPGSDNFVFFQNISNLQDGQYSFVVKCKDVNDHDGCKDANGNDTSVSFLVARPPRITLLDSSGIELSTSSFIGPSGVIGTGNLTVAAYANESITQVVVESETGIIADRPFTNVSTATVPLAGLGDGQYNVIVHDKYGQATSAAFIIQAPILGVKAPNAFLYS